MATLERKYPDFREHLERLAKYCLLHTVDIGINKYLHLHPFVRWSYVSDIEAKACKVFYFTNVGDSNGRKYKGDCDVCVSAANSSGAQVVRTDTVRGATAGVTRTGTVVSDEDNL